MTRFDVYDTRILCHLLSVDLTSVSELSKFVGISERTIRIKLETMSLTLNQNCLGKIVRKPRVGVWLEVNTNQKFKLLEITKDNGTYHASNTKDRVFNLVDFLIQNHQVRPISTQNIADFLYMSLPTAHKVIKKTESYLNKFNIEISNSRKKGVYLNCDEKLFRIFVADYLLSKSENDLDSNISSFYPSLNIEFVRKIIIDTEREWDISLDEKSYNLILINIVFALERYHKSHLIQISKDVIEMMEKYNEIGFASSLLNKISRVTGKKIVENEYWNLSLIIFASRFNDINLNQKYENSIYQYDKLLDEFVDTIVKTVGDVLNVDFSNDSNLKSSLIQHLRPIIFRKRNGYVQKNTALSYIKETYPKTFVAAWSTSVLFEEYFKLSVTEDEIAFIAIYFELAYQRSEGQINGYYITNDPISHACLMCVRLKRLFPRIGELKVVNYHDIKTVKFSKDEIIFTNAELDFIPNQICVNNHQLESNLQMVERKINQFISQIESKKRGFHVDCHSLFDSGLIFTQVEADNKEQIIKFLCEQLRIRGLATVEYLDTVLSHEALTSTSIGNGIAIPHGSQDEILESRVVCAMLKDPIKWDDEEVDIVFLLAVKMDINIEIRKTQLFYQNFVHLIDDLEKIDTLKSIKKPVEVYNWLLK